ncbi:hypothetical protein MSIMFB_04892 [Mycobacterium simulans]|uniref:Uncharacterized protein n=2 Tax=Mycobacterium simulans TaxID=627089 RepID=A0A7Z7NC41_9MYCO|nr:hypothetical protein MSIMFB_04892 [Mycobacterium simulans]
MSIFRVEFAQGFALGNEDVVLAVADRDGLRAFQSAVLTAKEEGEASFSIDRVKHQVVRQRNAADVELGPETVVWRLDDTKLAEIVDKNAPMLNSDRPGHQYIDYLNSPASTLVISVDEYV